MGMGDKKIPYSPKYAPIRDDVIGKEFAVVMMRSCPVPKVIERYGTGGVCNVSIYTCRRCRYKVTTPFCGALGCSYGVEQTVPDAKEN